MLLYATAQAFEPLARRGRKADGRLAPIPDDLDIEVIDV